jgi:hypothetical protein
MTGLLSIQLVVGSDLHVGHEQSCSVKMSSGSFNEEQSSYCPSLGPIA